MKHKGFLTTLGRTMNPSGLPEGPVGDKARMKWQEKRLSLEALLGSTEWCGSLVITDGACHVLHHPGGATCRLRFRGDQLAAHEAAGTHYDALADERRGKLRAELTSLRAENVRLRKAA